MTTISFQTTRDVDADQFWKILSECMNNDDLFDKMDDVLFWHMLSKETTRKDDTIPLDQFLEQHEGSRLT